MKVLLEYDTHHFVQGYYLFGYGFLLSQNMFHFQL